MVNFPLLESVECISSGCRFPPFVNSIFKTLGNALLAMCCVQSHVYLQYRHGMIEVTVQRLNHVFALEYSRRFHYSKQRGWFCALGADWHPVVTLVWSVENTSTSLSACFGVDSEQLDVCLHNNQ